MLSHSGGSSEQAERRETRIFKSFNYFNQILYHFDVGTLIMLPAEDDDDDERCERRECFMG
jgi:hypothetical protein